MKIDSGVWVGALIGLGGVGMNILWPTSVQLGWVLFVGGFGGAAFLLWGPTAPALQPPEGIKCLKAEYADGGVIWLVRYVLDEGYWGIEGVCPNDRGEMDADVPKKKAYCVKCNYDSNLSHAEYNAIKDRVKKMASGDWRSQWGRRRFHPDPTGCR
jgi:hypothetical protein